MKQTLLILFISIFYVGLAEAQVAISSHSLIAQHQTVAKGKLSVFPNPATDFIQLRSGDEVNEIIIYNVVGKRMISFDYMEGERYAIGELPNGMYLIQFVDRNKKIISTQRLSKR